MTIHAGTDGRTAEPPTPPPAEPTGRGGRLRWLRWLIPVLLLVGWLAIGAVGGPYQGKLGEVQRNDNASFLPADAESTRVVTAQRAFSQDQRLPAVVIVEKSGKLTPDELATIGQRAAAAATLSGVDGQVSPVIPSADGQAAQFVVPFASNSGEQIVQAVQDLRAEVTKDLPAGLTAHVTGPAGLIGDFAGAFGGIDTLLLGVAAGVVAFILLLVYRSPLMPLLVLASAGLALSLAVFVVYQLAKHDVLTLNGQSQGILFILVFGSATDYALLLVARFREELRRYPGRWPAMRVAYRASVEPIAASAGTVVLGLLCLLLSGLNSNRGLGPVAAIGIGASLVATLTFLPAALVLLGRAAFWPFRPKLGSAGPERAGVWARISAGVGRRPRLVWTLTAILLLACVAFVPQLKADGIAQSDLFINKSSVDSVVGQEALGRHFPAGTGSPAVIITKAGAEEPVAEAARGVPGVALAAVSRAANGLVEIDAVLNDPADSEAAVATVQRLRDAVHAVPGADAKVGGLTASQLDVQTAAKRDLRVIIPVVLIVVFLVLALLLRALVAPLMLIATVVLSFAATLGVAALVFNDVFRFPGADPSTPLFAFIFLVALGIDYNIFLMTRVREEAAKHGHRQGTLRGLAVTGGVITSAGVVLASTFAALAVLPILFLVQIAFLVAFGVLLDTLIVRSLLVPALTLDIGRVVWWPGRLSRGAR